VIAEYRTAPDEAAPSADPGTEFLRRACLTYSSADGPLQRSAADVLAEYPDLGRDNVWVAAARADVDAVGRLLRRDAQLAVRPGGPHHWPPIAYLTYARPRPAPRPRRRGRHRPPAARPRRRPGHRDFLWHGLPTPFTLLTGCFGHGEQGPEKQSRHPQEHALARLLLAAGADPNDAQGLYNRMFTPADDTPGAAVRVRARHRRRWAVAAPARGAGTEPGAAAARPARLGRQRTVHPPCRPARRARGRPHHPPGRYGVRRQTAYEAARTSGQLDVVRLLAERGVAGTPLPPEDEVIAAVLAGDRARSTGSAPRP